MRHVVEARDLVEDAAGRLGLARDIIERVFDGAPLDFTVIFGSTLPFRIDLLGMSGITLFGRVYLLERTAKYPPAELIVLVRHEAEHVRQQRSDRLFYPRYLTRWLRSFIFRSRGNMGGRWYDAYRSLPEEREAYGAGDRARALLKRK